MLFLLACAKLVRWRFSFNRRAILERFWPFSCLRLAGRVRCEEVRNGFWRAHEDLV